MTASGHPIPVVFLMGPTGVGKTEVALALARELPVEIVSVDSTLVYRGLNIGSAKPNPAVLKQVRHHLIDICDPREHYSAARFRHDALLCVDAIRSRGRLPLLVGGTGLYFRALEHGFAHLPDADPAVRAALNQELMRSGSAALHARLAQVDAPAAARIHPHDPQRVLRALEVYQLSGQKMSDLWQANQQAPLRQRPLKFVLAPPTRNRLHERIARRFRDMLERGFVNEVQSLRERGDLTLEQPALRSVGYREIWRYLHGELDFAQMCERGIIATRQLAKRQLTWLRREQGSTWCDISQDGARDRLLRLILDNADFQTSEN